LWGRIARVQSVYSLHVFLVFFFGVVLLTRCYSSGGKDLVEDARDGELQAEVQSDDGFPVDPSMDRDAIGDGPVEELLPLLQTWIAVFGGEADEWGTCWCQTSDGCYTISGMTLEASFADVFAQVPCTRTQKY
jgi:hypothetical protein